MKKINWGTGILIAIVCFISFIMFFIVRMSTDKKFDHDLVTEEYYKQELAFQDEINAKQNSANLVNNIHVNVDEQGIKIVFPAEKKNIEGTVNFYRPSSKKLDVEIPITLENQQMFVAAKTLVEGKYILSVNWTSGGESYLYTEDLQIRP
ncbi:FixH family protein [Mesonia aestuariivivens]|uniref:FixH family protein n=1 Tax=Mesonia aestuariivivens TaxID=2796128 RepID=A0ABS6W3F5_9FLAO|nr:FixH family protein [Mesonia aestuariivivens]MBW2962072.1 FixH family protein [Mesonia aestuariivivens]